MKEKILKAFLSQENKEYLAKEIMIYDAGISRDAAKKRVDMLTNGIARNEIVNGWFDHDRKLMLTVNYYLQKYNKMVLDIIYSKTSCTYTPYDVRVKNIYDKDKSAEDKLARWRAGKAHKITAERDDNLVNGNTDPSVIANMRDSCVNVSEESYDWHLQNFARPELLNSQRRVPTVPAPPPDTGRHDRLLTGDFLMEDLLGTIGYKANVAKNQVRIRRAVGLHQQYSEKEQSYSEPATIMYAKPMEPLRARVHEKRRVAHRPEFTKLKDTSKYYV